MKRKVTDQLTFKPLYSWTKTRFSWDQAHFYKNNIVNDRITKNDFWDILKIQTHS